MASQGMFFQEFGLFLADLALIFGHDARIAPSISC